MSNDITTKLCDLSMFDLAAARELYGLDNCLEKMESDLVDILNDIDDLATDSRRQRKTESELLSNIVSEKAVAELAETHNLSPSKRKQLQANRRLAAHHERLRESIQEASNALNEAISSINEVRDQAERFDEAFKETKEAARNAAAIDYINEEPPSKIKGE